MSRQFGLVITAFTLIACARASTTGGTTPANRDPCDVAGRCTIEVVIPNEVAPQLERYATYRVYSGCPRSLGFQDLSSIRSGSGTSAIQPNSSIRAGIPIVQAQNTTITIPRMQGRYVTVAIFYG